MKVISQSNFFTNIKDILHLSNYWFNKIVVGKKFYTIKKDKICSYVMNPLTKEYFNKTKFSLKTNIITEANIPFINISILSKDRPNDLKLILSNKDINLEFPLNINDEVTTTELNDIIRDYYINYIKNIQFDLYKSQVLLAKNNTDAECAFTQQIIEFTSNFNKTIEHLNGFNDYCNQICVK